MLFAPFDMEINVHYVHVIIKKGKIEKTKTKKKNKIQGILYVHESHF